MGLPLVQAISRASSPSSCARLTALLAGTAPARRATARMAPVKEFPFAAAAARFARGGRGNGDLGGGGGARRAGAGIYTALHLPSRKVPPFASSGGGAVLCLLRRADGVDLGDGDVVACANEDGDGGVGAGGGDRCIAKKHSDGDSEGAAAVVDQRHAEKDGNFINAAEAAAAGIGGGGNRADHACWRDLMYALGWAWVQGFATVFILGSVLFALYKIGYDRAYTYVYQLVKELILSYIDDEGIYRMVYAYTKNLLIGYLQDNDVRSNVRTALGEILYPSIPWRKIPRRR